MPATPTAPAGPQPGDLRIGELSRRVGVSSGTLRAWERRYGILSSRRTAGGYRLYTADDEARIRTLARLRDEGVATAEAARLAREDPHLAVETGHGTAEQAALSQAGARVAGRAAPCEEGVGASAPAPLREPVQSDRVESLISALRAFDEREANAILDDALAEHSLGAFLEGLVLPFLRELGDRWARDEATPAEEHFASSIIRGRLLGLGRGWGSGDGSLALLACPAGERHDLGLAVFGLLLHERGWRIAFVGQDTPGFALAATAESLSPEAVVISAVEPRRLREARPDLDAIAKRWRLFVGGAGASRRFAGRVGATFLEGEPSYAASVLDASLALSTGRTV